MKIFNKIKLEIRYIDEVKGFGVFTLEKINIGDIVETCYFLPIYNSNINPLIDYLFQIDKYKTTRIFPLGYGAIYNHSDSPNINWKVKDDNFIEFYSLKEIEPGDELCHDYGPNYWKTYWDIRKNRII
jgi:hypothetical protein